MGVRVRRGALPAVDPRAQVAQLLHARVQISAAERSRAHRVHDAPRGVQAGRRHLEPTASSDSRHRIVATAPVRDDRAVEAPLLAQDLREQMPVLVGVLTVDAVVGGHDHAGAGLSHHDLERGEVDLAQRALVEHRVARHAAQLLAVDREVLGAGGHSLRLDATHVAGGERACEVRILREVLEVAPAQWRALDVEARTQQHVHALRGGLGAQCPAHLLGQRGIPAVGDGRGRGKAGGRLGGSDSQVVARAGLLAHAVGTVREEQRPNPGVREGAGLPRVLAAQECGLLEVGELVRHGGAPDGDQCRRTAAPRVGG